MPDYAKKWVGCQAKILDAKAISKMPGLAKSGTHYAHLATLFAR
jgi:hypothetical protein